MYTCDVVGFLQMLKETGANCIIYTEGAGSEKPWQAQLTLIEGQVTFSQVQDSVNGQSLLRGGEAIRWLASQGNLTWKGIA